MSEETQVSATVSAATRDRLDRFAESRGLKKNYVVEQALLFFMDVLFPVCQDTVARGNRVS
jgi:predicted transcriptional regulator